MKTLYLLRHAKSDWSDPGLDDFDRPLNERGHKAGAAMAAYIGRSGILPDLVLVSSAKRTRETWSYLSDVLTPCPANEERVSLYLASKETLTSVIRSLDPEINSVMIIGHNPGMEELAISLANPKKGDPSGGMLARLAHKYPTGGLAELRFDIDSWVEVSKRSGTLIQFTTPKSL